MDALTRYHYAKEREESAVLCINDAYLEALNSLENLEAENARLREELADAPKCDTCEAMLDCDECLRADVSHKKRRQLSAENAKLREQSERLFDKTLELGTENSKLRELCKLCEREAENAKLRELAAGIGHLLFTLDVDYCATCPRDSINHPCPVYTVDGGECLYKTDLRELGVDA